MILYQEAAPFPFRPVLEDSTFKIPAWCFEDTPTSFSSQDDDGTYIYDVPPEELPNIVSNYRIKRRISYFACHWYHKLIANGVPTMESVIVKSSIKTLAEDLKPLIKGRKFIRLCGSSPKDIRAPPIFNARETDFAAKAIMGSFRTHNITQICGHCCLFVREVQRIKIESRCIIHKHKLRAVAVYKMLEGAERAEYEELLLDFFKTYIDKLPYNSCVVEIGIDEVLPFVIEFNSFGVDGFAGASQFSWEFEREILYNSDTPVFRYSNESM